MGEVKVGWKCHITTSLKLQRIKRMEVTPDLSILVTSTQNQWTKHALNICFFMDLKSRSKNPLFIISPKIYYYYYYNLIFNFLYLL